MHPRIEVLLLKKTIPAHAEHEIEKYIVIVIME